MEQCRISLGSRKKSLMLKVMTHFDGIPRKPIVSLSRENFKTSEKNLL